MIARHTSEHFGNFGSQIDGATNILRHFSASNRQLFTLLNIGFDCSSCLRNINTHISLNFVTGIYHYRVCPVNLVKCEELTPQTQKQKIY